MSLVVLQEAAKSLRILQSRAAAMDNFEAELEKHGNVAMIIYPDSSAVVLVHWISAHTYQGRVVRTDDSHKLVYSIPAVCPIEHFTKQSVVHPNCGVRMLKVTKQHRPLLPVAMQRLRRVLECALVAGEIVPSFEHCICCSEIVNGENGLLCPVCLLAWHDDCSKRLARHTKGWLSASDFCHVERWPEALQHVVHEGGVCPLCLSVSK